MNAEVNVTVDRTDTGALVVVDGEVRATFTGDLAAAEGQAALAELLQELFGSELPPAIRSMPDGDLT